MDILKFSAFTTIPLRALQYLDCILAKTQEDKYNFFKGFARTLPVFSLRLLRTKVMPLFVSEVMTEPKFGPVLIPLIFEIGKALDKPAFYRDVFLPLSRQMILVDPPEFLLAVLTCFPTLISQVEDGSHYDYCYPILAAALTSKVNQLHREALNHVSLMVSKMKNDMVERVLLPAMIDLFSNSDSKQVVCACVLSLAALLPKLGAGVFCEMVGPRLLAAWNRLRGPPELGDAISAILGQVEAETEMMMRELVPLASEVLSSDENSPGTQLKLCQFILGCAKKFGQAGKRKAGVVGKVGLSPMFSGLRMRDRN
jgi:hypothetical protein